jgi:hypothetical protein
MLLPSPQVAGKFPATVKLYNYSAPKIFSEAPGHIPLRDRTVLLYLSNNEIKPGLLVG